jgi:hypothetical protein
MINNVEIANGDMIAMAKVVNENTVNLDKKLNQLIKEADLCFTDIDNRINNVVTSSNKSFDKTAKAINKYRKAGLLLSLCVLGIDLIVMAHTKELGSIERRLRALEDEKTKKDFYGSDDEDSLK